MQRYYFYDINGCVRATQQPVRILSLASIEDIDNEIENIIAIVKEGEYLITDIDRIPLLTIDDIVSDKGNGKRNVVNGADSKVVSPMDASKAVQDYLDQQQDTDKVEIPWDDVAGIVHGKIAAGAKTRKDKYWQLEGWKCVSGGNVLVFERELLV